MCDELKIPMGLAVALVADRVELLEPLKEEDFVGHDTLRILKWLAASVIKSKEELKDERIRREKANRALYDLQSKLGGIKTEIDHLFQEGEES